MNSQCWPTILSQVLSDIIGDTLSSDEDEDFCVLIADDVEMFQEFPSLFEVRADLDELSDVVVGSQLHRTDGDLDEVVQEILNSQKIK